MGNSDSKLKDIGSIYLKTDLPSYFPGQTVTG